MKNSFSNKHFLAYLTVISAVVACLALTPGTGFAYEEEDQSVESWQNTLDDGDGGGVDPGGWGGDFTEVVSVDVSVGSHPISSGVLISSGNAVIISSQGRALRSFTGGAVADITPDGVSKVLSIADILGNKIAMKVRYESTGAKGSVVYDMATGQVVELESFKYGPAEIYGITPSGEVVGAHAGFALAWDRNTGKFSKKTQAINTNIPGATKFFFGHGANYVGMANGRPARMTQDGVVTYFQGGTTDGRGVVRGHDATQNKYYGAVLNGTTWVGAKWNVSGTLVNTFSEVTQFLAVANGHAVGFKKNPSGNTAVDLHIGSGDIHEVGDNVQMAVETQGNYVLAIGIDPATQTRKAFVLERD